MKLLKQITALLFLLMGIACVSCSDDEDGNGSESAAGVNSVFVNGMPKSAWIIQSFTYDDKGRVSAMSLDYGKVTFQYAKGTVRMTIYEGDELFLVSDMSLGSNGFVSKYTDTYYIMGEEEGTSIGEYKYNSDGQLTYWALSDKGSSYPFYECSITYKNGDIVKVKKHDWDNDDPDWETEILYTSSSVSSPIDNKGCVMLFDETFDIDLDEYGYAYYAGLLGKATKHLPVGYRNDDGTVYHKWTLNSNGFPTKFGQSGYTVCEFEW